VAPVTKSAVTVTDGAEMAKAVHAAVLNALTAHRGPTFVDVPMDVLFARTEADVPEPAEPERIAPDPDEVERAAALMASASRPAIIAGSDVYWAGAWDALAAAVEHLRVPCFANGMGRGCLPAGHPLAFSRTRGLLRAEADVVIVIGTPLDFRLGFGSFGSARVVHIADSPDGLAHHVDTAAAPAGDLDAILRSLADWSGARSDHEAWISRLADAERASLARERDLLDADADPIRPTRVFGELGRRLERDAVVICDGGDFASYAGKYVDIYTPGTWLDTGPYGCLGNGPGYTIAARLARPSSQIVAILGDGAAGFSLMDVDTMVRHGLPSVLIVGNNGMWGLEKHPMQAVYGWDMACDLQPGCRYDQVAQAPSRRTSPTSSTSSPTPTTPTPEAPTSADAPLAGPAVTGPSSGR
jgi:acetolactate synthase-1/2/3 large subunit